MINLKAISLFADWKLEHYGYKTKMLKLIQVMEYRTYPSSTNPFDELRQIIEELEKRLEELKTY